MNPSPVTFRPATADDATDMVDVHFAAVRGVPAGHYADEVLAAWSPAPDDQRRNWLANLVAQREAVCEVAVLAGGAVAGFCLAFPGEARLQALYVHPQHSGRGIGTGLLRAVEARCVAAGATSLELNASYNAAPFYRASGYAPVRETTQTLADGTTMGAILMSKSLAAHARTHARRSAPGIDIVADCGWQPDQDERQTAAADATGRQMHE